MTKRLKLWLALAFVVVFLAGGAAGFFAWRSLRTSRFLR